MQISDGFSSSFDSYFLVSSTLSSYVGPIFAELNESFGVLFDRFFSFEFGGFFFSRYFGLKYFDIYVGPPSMGSRNRLMFSLVNDRLPK